MRKLLVLLCGLVVASCAIKPVDVQKVAAYRKVAIASAMGDVVTQSAVGIMVFGNDSKPAQVPIGADKRIAAHLRKALASRYEVVDLTERTPTMLNAEKAADAAGRRLKTGDLVREQLGDVPVDAYVLIVPTSAPVRGTNQGFSGIGLMKLQRMLRSDDFFLYAAYAVKVVDGKTFEPVGEIAALPLGETPGSSLFSGNQMGAPSWPIIADLYLRAAEQADRLGEMFDLLMQQSLPETLRRANLL
jgi:hypothetical protein